MAEQFFAIRGASLYPESRGSKVMPESGAANVGGGKELGKTPATNGPTSPEAKKGKGGTKQEKTAEGAANRDQGEERTRRAQELQKELREARESTQRTREQAKTPSDKKISFADAASIAEIAEAVGKKTGAVIHPHEIARFKKILQEFGSYNAEAVSKMDHAAIIVAAYEVLKTAPVDRAKIKDIKIADKAGREEEEARLGDLISGVKTSAVGLSKDEVEKYVTVPEEGFGYGEAEEGGPGAMAPAVNIRGEAFKALLLEKWEILRQPAAQQNQQRLGDLNNEIQRRVVQGDPWEVGTADRDLSEVLVSIRHDPNRQNEFNTTVLDVGSQQNLRTMKNLMDQNYDFMLDELADDAKFRDLVGAGNVVLSGLTSGWVDRAQAESILREKALVVRDIPESEGMRLWFARRQLETVLASYEINQKTRVQADPIENYRAAEESMLFFEQSQTVEGFQLARQRLSDLLFAIERTTDPRVTAEMKDTLRRRIEAFQIVTPIWITMYQSEGDPETMQRAVNPLGNETFFNYFDRFSDLRDENGESYLRYVDAQGNVQIANFGTEAVRALSYQYQVDRHRANLVQEMTRRGLNINSPNPDEQWIIKHILGLPQNQPLPHLTLAQINQLRAGWDDDTQGGPKTRAIMEWYAQQTMVGVDGFAPNSSEELVYGREDEVMGLFDTQPGQRSNWIRQSVRERLIALGIPQQRVDALLANDVLTRAVKAVAANYVRFSMASGLDRLRVYNRRGELVVSLFGEETPFFMREVDQMTDYFFSEVHGDVNVNRLIREEVDERWRSFFLASNQITYRIVAQLKEKNLLSPGMAANIEHEQQHELDRVRAATGLQDLRRPEVDAYVIMDMIYRFNPDNPNDPTTIDLSMIDLAQASKELDSYTFTDNANDRTQTVRWFRQEFKAFTFQPFREQLFAMLDKYYSSRHIRKRQAMDFFLDIFGEAGQHWKDWLDYKDNITSVQMEAIIQEAIEHNVLDKPRAEQKKAQLLGRPVVREAKQWGILIFEGLKDLVRPGSLLGGFWDFWKTLFVYLTQQK